MLVLDDLCTWCECLYLMIYVLGVNACTWCECVYLLTIYINSLHQFRNMLGSFSLSGTLFNSLVKYIFSDIYMVNHAMFYISI